MSKPRVSVIIPNYNHARFLDRRLRSVREQTFSDFEIIFLDDASPDDSRAVFEQHASDPRIAHAVFNDTNSGSPFRQWNRGLQLARGELIWIAESDDDCSPELLARLVRAFDENPNVGIACCPCVLVHDDGREETPTLYARPEPSPWRNSFVMPGPEICAREFIFINAIPNASGAVFKRRLALDAGMADPTWRLCGDWKFWVDILLRSDLAFIAEPLNRFRTHGGTARHATRRMGLDIREHYRMSAYLKRKLSLPPETLATARWLAARRWATLLREGGFRLPPGVHAGILREAFPFDPFAPLRLIKALRAP
jgi:glycosyltransferase involved in cell wall biosynthesis